MARGADGGEPGRSAASGAVVGGARGAGAGAARSRGRGRKSRGLARGVPRGRPAGRGLSLRPAQGIRAPARAALRRRRAEPPDRHEREDQRDTRGADAGPRRRRVGGSPGAAGPAEHVRRAQGAGDPAPIPRHPRDDGFAHRGLGSDDDVRHDGLDGEQLLPGELVPADVAHGHGRRPAPSPDDRRELRLRQDRNARPAGTHYRGRHRPRAVPPHRLCVPRQRLPMVGTRQRWGRARGGMGQRRALSGGRVARAGSQLRALSLPRPRVRVGGRGRVVQHHRVRRRLRRDGRRQWPHAFQRGAEGLARLARLRRLASRHRRRRERQLHDRSARDARDQPEGAPDPDGPRRLAVRGVPSARGIRQLHLHQRERDERSPGPLLQRRPQRRLSPRHDADNLLVVRSRSSRRDDLPGCCGQGEHHAHRRERDECDRQRHRRGRLLRPAGADRDDHSGTAGGRRRGRP